MSPAELTVTLWAATAGLLPLIVVLAILVNVMVNNINTTKARAYGNVPVIPRAQGKARQ